MQNERDDLSPILHSLQPQRRHHLNVRSPSQCPEERMKAALESIRNQALNSHSTLMGDIDGFTKVRFAQTKENTFKNWSRHSLSLDHRYNTSVTRKIGLDKQTCNNMSLPQKTMDEKLREIADICRTFKILQSVLKETVNEKNKKEWQDTYNKEYHVIIDFLNSTSNELAININAAHGAYNSTKNCTTINFDHLISDTIIPNYNRNAQVREWLIVVEIISFFQFVITTLNEMICK
ncbi:uncharacterized protein LOC120773406 [Bactrocera tryoni]|uniref:uncharacterized protein LOC120773406 n=1 Tax=Bactrocera tryoni TaxID=59916 RepID=UPI001A98D958|nr:uncharacterized protein LOC120773406 [Bactrocera tryoni]